MQYRRHDSEQPISVDRLPSPEQLAEFAGNIHLANLRMETIAVFGNLVFGRRWLDSHMK